MSRTESVVFPVPQNLHVAELAIDAFKHQYDNAFPIRVLIRGSVEHRSGICGYLSDWHQIVKLQSDEEYCLGLANPGGETIWVKPRWSTKVYDDAHCEMMLESVLQE